MRINVECIPCFTRQAIATTRRCTDDPAIEWEVVRRVSRLIAELSPESTPPDFAADVYGVVSEFTGVDDPFCAQKVEANNLAMAVVAELGNGIEDFPDPLLAAVKLSIAGNSMDLGVVTEFGDVGDLARRVMETDLGVDDYEELRARVKAAKDILVIGDNTGEIVFDRVLIERMRRINHCRYTYMVRGRPVINDVTRKDATDVGIDGVAEVADTGAGTPGLVLSTCSKDAHERFMNADLVISKGQGNYESLSDAPREVFFLLLAKCDVVSRELQVPVGSAVAKHHRP